MRMHAVVGIAVAVAIAGCAQPGSVEPVVEETRATGAALAGTEWQLVEMVIYGDTVALGAVDAVLRFDGEGEFSANACNYQDGRAEIGERTLVLSGMSTTEAYCPGLDGDIDRALGSLQEQQVDWTVDGDCLRLATADGTSLRYQVRAEIYPAADARTVVSGEPDGAQFRLAVGGSGDDLSLGFESRAAPGKAWGTSWVAAPDPGERPMWSLVGGDVSGREFVAGFVPADTTRATHQAAAGSPASALEVYDIGDPKLAVIGGFVPDHSECSILLAYDDAGMVVAEWITDHCGP